VIRAIDAWLADADSQRIFEYQAWDYRGERFLVPMRPGMSPVPLSARDVRDEMHESHGRRVPYVYYDITAEDFASLANCTYAYKFHAGMNSACNEPSATPADGATRR
jgi:hypothetical protein